MVDHCSRLATARWIFTLAVVLVGQSARAETPDYAPSDDRLRQVLLDSSPTESFLAVQPDTAGRLFVGGRQTLFVYEPDAQGGYATRKELYRFPDHTWIYDIALRGSDVYVLTVSALYVIPGAVERRENLKPKRLVWGVPLGHVHQCFHGMAWGPEGDLYFAMGDPLWYYGDFNRPDHWGHWTFFSQPDGTRTPYNGVGGVFRCRPDGSRFQVVSRGLRNSCGLCFDRHWNLFTNDNDHEQMPAQYVPGRLVHVTPHSYFNWPRGWMLSKTPDRADMLETMFEGMGRAVPVGQAYYHDLLLPEAYRDNLLVARWCIRSLTRYPLTPRGASFQVTEEHVLDGVDQARPVGVGVGRGGRVFVTIAYMAQNEGSPVYRSDLVMLTTANDPPDHPYAPYDAMKAPLDRLWAELSDPSWSRRYAAHVELLRRGGKIWEGAIARLNDAAADDPALEHLIWLAAASRTPAARQALTRRTQDANPMHVLQAVRALTEFFNDQELEAICLRLLGHRHPQVRHAAVLGCFGRSGPTPDEIVSGPARSRDTYLRQAATLLLAERAPMTQLTELCGDADSGHRLAGCLAAGFRLTLPPATSPLADALPLDSLRTEEAYNVQYADEKIDLRTLGRVGNYTLADHWKLGGRRPEQEELFSMLLALLDDADEQVRLQAAHFLSLLNDARSEPGVVRVVADNEERRLLAAKVMGAAKVWVAGPFADGNQGLERSHPPEEAAVDLAAEYPSGTVTVAWRQLDPTGSHFDLAKAYGPDENVSYYAYCRLESGSRQRIQLLVGSNDGVRVWQNGRPVWTNDTARGALPFQDTISLLLEPGGNDLLIRVRNRKGECGFYLHYRSLGEAALVLPDKLDLAGLAERLASAAQDGGQTAMPAEFLNVDWATVIPQGDPVQGKKLFEAAGCAKCHASGADASTVGGPSLGDASKRFTIPYLVESVLLPNKQISPVFRATQVVMSDGWQLSGLLVGETAEKIDLLLPDAKRVTLAKAEIDERELTNLSPMPQGVVKRPDELRDILAFLLQGGK